MQAKDMWEKFVKANHLADIKYDVWSFGSDADKLAELVLKGEKTGTTSAFDLYEMKKESLPQVGDYSIILDSNNMAKCVIQTTKVYVVPFNEVTGTHAQKEGEGDKSLEYWRMIHKEFFIECLKDVGLEFEENRKVVCEEFQVVYK